MEGSTIREHLEAAARRTGRLPDRLATAPRLPVGCELLWLDFVELSAARSVTMAGAARISHHDIDAYQRVHGVRFAPWQIDAIRRADAAFLESQRERDA